MAKKKSRLSLHEAQELNERMLRASCSNPELLDAQLLLLSADDDAEQPLPLAPKLLWEETLQRIMQEDIKINGPLSSQGRDRRRSDYHKTLTVELQKLKYRPPSKSALKREVARLGKALKS